MDTGLNDSLRGLYNQGVRRGYLSAKADHIGLRAFLVAIGWAAGVITGVVITGFLP